MALWTSEPSENRPPNETLQMTMSELALFLEGSELAGRVAPSPPPFVFGKSM